MPAEGRLKSLTKHIAAYLEEVPRAWDAYLKEKSKGTEQGKAERIAMRSVYPGDNNIGVRLKIWKKHKLWPEDATEEIRETWEALRASVYKGTAQDKAESEAVRAVLKGYPHSSDALEIWKRCGVWSAQSVGLTEEYRGKPSISRDHSGVAKASSRKTDEHKSQDKPRKARELLGMPRDNLGLTREDILAQMRVLLAELDIEDRKWFGKATGKAPEEDKFLPIGAKLPPEVVLEIKSLPGRIAHHLEKALKLYLMVLASGDKWANKVVDRDNKG